MTKQKTMYLFIFLVASLMLNGCTDEKEKEKEKEKELRSIIAEREELFSNVGVFWMLLQKEEAHVESIDMVYSPKDEIFTLWMDHVSDEKMAENKKNGKPLGRSIVFELDSNGINTLISVLNDPVKDYLEVNQGFQRWFYRSKYSDEVMRFQPNTGLYFKRYQSMLIITNSYSNAGNNQIHIKLNDAPKLAKLLQAMKESLR